MKEAQASRARSLLDEFCVQLGILLERRHTQLALVAARDQAQEAALLAQESMRQAQEADRAKTNFLANVTHELRTPLNSIIGFSEIIQAASPHSETTEHAKYIHSSGTHLLKILNKVLDLARLEAGKLPLEDQVVPLEEVFEAAIRVVRVAAADASIALGREGVGDFLVKLDPAKMTQVLANLLSNAIAFTPAGGRITMRAGLDPQGNLRISVEDTGSGIAKEYLERVLQPFGQAEDHLTRRNEGIGLGLPIARALIRAHGGDLSIDSEVGVGTTVDIRVPAARLQAVAAAAAR